MVEGVMQRETGLKHTFFDVFTSDSTVSIAVIPIQRIMRIPDAHEVWAPHDPAAFMIDRIEEVVEKGELSFNNTSVLDVGTGSGILGLYALMRGARRVVFTDYNEKARHAVRDTLNQNGYNWDVLEKQGVVKFIYSDRFEEVDEKFDIILSNPPQQPENEDAHRDNPLFKTNENGSDGMLVLRALIQDSKKYLNDNGVLVTSFCSRQGYNEIRKMYDGNWGTQPIIIGRKFYPIKIDYHGPYLQWIIDKQREDSVNCAVIESTRIFVQDENGLRPAYTVDDVYTHSETACYIYDVAMISNL
jgi:16S rRNA G966 N2-methylase RsmD